MAAPPLRTALEDIYPKPSNVELRQGLGKFWDYVTALLGETGNAPEARVALGLGGTVLQVVSSETTSTSTGSGTIPVDNTIPQITEGNEILSVTITPKSATSKLIVEAAAHLAEATNTGNWLTAALFRNSNADAISASTISGATSVGYDGSTNIGRVDLCKHEIASGTSAITFRLRVGVDSGVVRINGAGGQLLVGRLTSFLRVTEVAA